VDYGEDSSMGFYGQARSTTCTPRAGRLHPAPERARRLLDAASGPWPSRLRGLARGPRTSGSTEIQIQIQRTRAGPGLCAGPKSHQRTKQSAVSL
jgi:hypothetical protein